MTNEEIQRTMEFILTQQAQFAANMQQLQEGQKQLQEGQKQLQAAQARTEQLVTHLTNVLREVVDEQVRMREHMDARFAEIADLQVRTDERFAELADSLAHTDQKLNALIDIVREGRNGKA